MTQREIIYSLGGPRALSRMTGLKEKTLQANAVGKRKWTAPSKLLFKILLVLNEKGLLLEIIHKVNEAEDWIQID